VERRSLSRLVLGAAGAIALASIVVGVRAAAGAEQLGIFALLGSSAKVVSTARSQPAGATATLLIRQFQPDGKTPILAYDVDMQKPIHLIVVRDDLGEFMHLHPTLERATGTFRQSFSREPGRRYYAYADTTPHGIGQQVFRFTIAPDGTTPQRQPSPQRLFATPSPPSVSAGPYAVALARTTLRANAAQPLDLTVLKGGRPASDLVPYLGAAAHAVFIETSTLAYVHIHPTLRGASAGAMGAMNMDANAQAGPRMTMQVPALPAGSYKLWLQFGGAGGAVYTAPFTILVR
jgi:hypothetical protein